MRGLTLSLCVIGVLSTVAAGDVLSLPALSDLAVYSHSDLNVRWKAKVHGHAAARDGVHLFTQADVNGDIYAGGVARLDWKASAGNVYDGLGAGAFGALMLPDAPSGFGGDDIRVAERDSLNLAPGSYGRLEVAWQGDLTLTAGTYYFDSLTFGDHSDITLDASAGDILIVSGGESRMNWKSRARRQGAGAVTLASAGRFTMEEARFDGGVFCGDRVDLGWKANVAGQIHAFGPVNIGDKAVVGGEAMAPVPEPATGVLLALGAGALLLRQRRE
jgi:hypothetical protein